MATNRDLPDTETGLWDETEVHFHRSRVIALLLTDHPPGTTIRPNPKFEAEYRGRFESVAQNLGAAGIVRRIGPWAVLELPPGGSVLDIVNDWPRREALAGELRFVEPDLVVEAAQGAGVPVLPHDKYMQQPAPGDPPLWQWGMTTMEMPHAWALQQGDDSVFVAIVDSAIIDHVDLDLGRFWWGGNFRTDPADPPGTIVKQDADGVFVPMPDPEALSLGGKHGTGVAGAVAAVAELVPPVPAGGQDVSGVAGMNWGSPVGICRALAGHGGGLQGDVFPAVIQALRFGESVNRNLVVNLSLSFRDDPPLPDSELSTFEFLVLEARAAGAILACSAGNIGDPEPRRPARFASSYPDTVIAVGQTELTDLEAADPDRPYLFAHEKVSVVAPGHDLPILSDQAEEWDTWMNSSSLATPHVSGLVSLMWSHNPELTAAEIIDKLKVTAHKPAGADSKWGEGSVRALRALRAVEPRAVLSLVVDKSGSMELPSGTAGLTRMDVLRGAVDVLVNVLEPRSHVGVVSFDEAPAEVVAPVEIDPEHPDLSRAAVTDPIAPIVPSGMTSVGGGVQAGRTQVANVPDETVTGVPKRAIVLVTDGRENHAPWIVPRPGQEAVDLAAIGVPVYSIGAGTSEAVGEEALIELSEATRGEHLVTGTWDDESEQLLAKFLVQHVTSIVGDTTILDPTGVVRPDDGAVEIPFPVTALERRVDVVLVVPAEADVELELVTPDDTVIDPGTARERPGVVAHEASRVRLYRVHLPYRHDKSASHAGTWKAVLRAEAEDVPYTLLVNARSRLRLRTTTEQTGTVPGSSVRFRVDLEAIRTEAVLDTLGLEATIARPNGTVETVKAGQDPDGGFELELELPDSGAHHCRLTVSGTVDGHAFTREKTLTAAVHEPAELVDEDRLDRRRRPADA